LQTQQEKLTAKRGRKPPKPAAGVTRCGMGADAFSIVKGKEGYTDGRVLFKGSAYDPPFFIINQIN
jgi:hypothetical protein